MGIPAKDQHARNGGNAFSWFTWKDEVIGFAQSVAHQSPRPVTEAVAIHPLNFLRPVEIMTPRAISYGMVTLTLIELWNEAVWDRLQLLSGSTDLADILSTIYDSGDDDIQLKTVIAPPNASKIYHVYHGCKIVDVRDDETIDVTTMQINKDITVWYAWCSRTGRNQLYDNNGSKKQ